MRLTGTFCRFHDRSTHLCMVFNNRFECNPGCLPIQEMIADRLLPQECGYVKDIPAYKTIVRDYETS